MTKIMPPFLYLEQLGCALNTSHIITITPHPPKEYKLSENDPHEKPKTSEWRIDVTMSNGAIHTLKGEEAKSFSDAFLPFMKKLDPSPSTSILST